MSSTWYSTNKNSSDYLLRYTNLYLYAKYTKVTQPNLIGDWQMVRDSRAGSDKGHKDDQNVTEEQVQRILDKAREENKDK